MRILYIGNKLSKHGFTPSNIETLGIQLSMYFDIITVSDKRNKIYRMIDMVISIIKYHNSISKVLIDTYSTSNFYYAVIASFLCQLFKTPYIPILHGGNLPERLERSKRLSLFLFGRSLINISPSGYLKAEFEKRGYENVMLIPNNIEIMDYYYKRRTSVRPRLLWVRAFAFLYNPMMAIHVLKRLQDKYPDACLCMIGQDKDGAMKECKILAKELGLVDKVQFTGKLSKEEWRRVSEQYDLFINTTNVDNTPVSVIEAMALGLPVISTNVGGIPYLLENGKDSLLVNADDEEGMVARIEELIHQSDEVQRLTAYARKKVESFDWEVVKESWIKILS